MDSFLLWIPISISGIFSSTGKLSFKFCQAWVWIGKTIALVRIEVIKNEKVDATQSYIIISNHQSLYDIPAMMLKVGLPFRWVIKKTFKKVPMFGWALYLAKHVFIDRSNPRTSLREMDAALSSLPKGVSVAVFAEGTRSDDGVVREFKSGGFLMAVRSGLPILPVTINGSWRVMPNKSSMSFNPGRIQVVIGDPIDTSGYTRKNMKELIEKTRNQVIANLDPEFPNTSKSDS